MTPYKKVWGTRFYACRFPSGIEAAVVSDFGDLVLVTLEAV